VSGLLLLCPGPVRRRLVPHLVSYAGGTLLGAAFLGLLPHALAEAAPPAVLRATLASFLLFFVLEKLLLWRHCHDPGCDRHGAAGPLLLIGDALHNFGDGVMLAAAFVTAIPLGVATALAVVAHEIPQEVGDFAILLDDGYSRRRALLLNTLSGLATLPGAVLGYVFLAAVQPAIPYVMALAAASFLYIATVDLIPGLHRATSLAAGARQGVLLLVGVATIAVLGLHA
jgi:zinc and cadmium transporter